MSRAHTSPRSTRTAFWPTRRFCASVGLFNRRTVRNAPGQTGDVDQKVKHTYPVVLAAFAARARVNCSYVSKSF
jgi:hypothetical protein